MERKKTRHIIRQSTPEEIEKYREVRKKLDEEKPEILAKLRAHKEIVDGKPE